MHPERFGEDTSICDLSSYMTKYFPSWEKVSSEMQKNPLVYPIESWTREQHESLKSNLEVYYSIDANASIMFSS